MVDKTVSPTLTQSAQSYARDYMARTRQFSRNANLYVLHVIGMDMIHGSFTVLFNLYLLAAGFDITFIGLRLMIGFIASALTAMPAGLVSDRIGRKASFILGDGIGAVIGVVMISTQNELILLWAPAAGAFFGNLHHTSEAAFMMENSKKSERVHLFSVAGSFRTLSAMAGALIAGMVPVLFIDDIGAVAAYRYASYAGLSLWFVSLAPALMLRPLEAEEQPETQTQRVRRAPNMLAGLFADIRHPRRITYFVLTSALLAVGTAAVAPLLNVVFHEGHIHAGEGEIGMVFAAGELSLAAATLFVPLVAARMLKVDAIALMRVLSLPFILAMGLLPLALGEGALLILLAGASHVGRVSTFGMSRPLDDAFNMEVLEPRERATSTGIEIAVGAAVSAGAVWLGARLLASGDYTTPFIIMATFYLVATLIYWRVFRPLERSGERPTTERLELAAGEAVAG